MANGEAQEQASPLSAGDLQVLEDALGSEELTDDELDEIESLLAQEFDPNELTDEELNAILPLRTTAGAEAIPPEDATLASATEAGIGLATGIGTGLVTKNLPLSAAATAGAQELTSLIFEKTGLKRPKTLPERASDVAINFAFDLAFGKAFDLLSKTAGPVATKFKNAGVRLADNADADAMLARALIDSPEDFNKSALRLGVGGDAKDAVETVRSLRRTISRAPIGVQREAFKNINREIDKGLVKSQKMLDTILTFSTAKLPDSSITLGQLDFDGMIGDLQNLRSRAADLSSDVDDLDFGVSLTGAGQKSILRVFNAERNKLIKDALGPEYGDYIRAQKTVQRLEKKFPGIERGDAIDANDFLRRVAKRSNAVDDPIVDTKKMKDLADYADAAEDIAAFENVIAEHPLSLEQVNDLRKQFDKLGRLNKRATSENLAERIGAEAYFLLAHRLRGQVADKLAEVGLKDQYQNAGTYYGLLRRLEPETSAAALREAPGGQARRGFDALTTIFTPSRYDELQAGLGNTLNIGSTERFVGRALAAPSALAEQLALLGTADKGFALGLAASEPGQLVAESAGLLTPREARAEELGEVNGINLSGLAIIDAQVPPESLNEFSARVRQARKAGLIDRVEAQRLVSDANNFQRLKTLTPSGMIEAVEEKNEQEQEQVQAASGKVDEVEVTDNLTRKSTSLSDSARD
jgi:hypothetical protein